MKAYITRYSAIGDAIHASHLPRLLKEREGFDYVCFEYNQRCKSVYQNNPFIDEHIIFDPTHPMYAHKPLSYLTKRYEQIMKRRKFDKHIDLFRSIEYGYIAMEDQNVYYESSKSRREKFGGMNYYDQTTVFAGYPEHVGMVGELHFTQQEEDLVKGIYERAYKDKFVVIANLSGTSKHKLFYNAEKIIKSFLDRHTDAICITMGDEEARKNLDFMGERIINRAGSFDNSQTKAHYPMRQSMLMAKYANLVIGCESGLMVAATLLGAPTVQLMTAASIKNHGGDFINDYSIQSPAACSPCHKGPYNYHGCPRIDHLGEWYPACIKFDVQTVINKMDEVYDAWSRQRASDEMPALR